MTFRVDCQVWQIFFKIRLLFIGKFIAEKYLFLLTVYPFDFVIRNYFNRTFIFTKEDGFVVKVTANIKEVRVFSICTSYNYISRVFSPKKKGECWSIFIVEVTANKKKYVYFRLVLRTIISQVFLFQKKFRSYISSLLEFPPFIPFSTFFELIETHFEFHLLLKRTINHLNLLESSKNKKEEKINWQINELYELKAMIEGFIIINNKGKRISCLGELIL